MHSVANIGDQETQLTKNIDRVVLVLKLKKVGGLAQISKLIR